MTHFPQTVLHITFFSDTRHKVVLANTLRQFSVKYCIFDEF